MAPRSYRSTRRAAVRDATRRKIVEATAALHAQHGIVATSHAMIAARADVSIPTVYNHFPTRGALVLACGTHITAGAPPLGLQTLEGKRTPRERIAALVRGVFDLYA